MLSGGSANRPSAQARRERGSRSRIQKRLQPLALSTASPSSWSDLAVFRAKLLAPVPWCAFKYRAYIKTASSCVGTHITSPHNVNDMDCNSYMKAQCEDDSRTLVPSPIAKRSDSKQWTIK